MDGSVLELVANAAITATARLPAAREEGRLVRGATVGGSCELRDMTVAAFPPSSGPWAPT